MTVRGPQEERTRDRLVALAHRPENCGGEIFLAIKEFVEEFDVLSRRLADAETALRFYADEDNWTQPTPWGGRIWDDEAPASTDGGKVARAALPSDPQPIINNRTGPHPAPIPPSEGARRP